MRQNGTPILDKRDAAAIASELMARRPAYVPEWLGREGHAGWALLQVFARYMQALVTRLKQAPDKNKLAFLDMLGLSLIPPQAARAPVVFQLTPNAVDGRVPAGSRVAAPTGPERETPLMFETEAAIGLASAKLAEVVTLWPGRDQYADHSAEAVGRQPFHLFKPLKAVPHILYLAHDTLFGFAGKSSIELVFDLLTPSSESLDIVWEYWDGQVWRGFKGFKEIKQATLKDSVDGTEGLTRSGVVRLVTDCAETAKRQVNGIESFWLRGRLSDREPLPPDPSAQLPVVESIRLGSVVERPLKISAAPPGTRLVRDLFQEMSHCIHGIVQEQSGAPVEGASVYVGMPIVLRRPRTTNERGYYYVDDLQPGTYTVTAVFGGLSASVTREYPEALAQWGPLEVDFIIEGLQPDMAFSGGLALDTAQSFYPFGQQPQPGTAFYFTNEEIFSKPGAEVEILVVRATTPQDRSEIIPSFTLTGTPPPSDADTLEHQVAWEYWNGRRWVAIAVTAEPKPTGNERMRDDLDKTAVIRFAVPSDMAWVKVNDQEALWMRVRLVSGGFGSIQIIEWTDLADLWRVEGTAAAPTNRYTQILTKPPALSAFCMGYTYRSPRVVPEVGLTYNDFQYADRTDDVRWPGRTMLPYCSVADSTPTLYLGFDRPLPVDRISLYLDIEEEKGIVEGPPLVWEYWDGTAWRDLAVTDETANLRLPGMLSFIGPTLSPLPKATVLQAHNDRIQVTHAEEAARFRADDQVWIQQGGTSELATVDEVQGNLILTQVPLKEIYTGGGVRLADLARFGTPRQWIRGRMKEDGKPVDSKVKGLHLNAVWAAQVQTVNNEILGASSGQPDQIFSFRQTPVLPGEVVEVCELEGVRAQVEFPILKEELEQQGVPEADIRAVRDSEGRVTEVWVRWRSQSHLFFSGSQDRHYVIDRAGGWLVFGDGVNGKIPPIGIDNILARQYRFGGGQAGNVPAGAITQLLSGVPAVQAITNPRPAEGGTDDETVEAVKTRGPQSIRHRRRALSAQDYEALAREASPGIGVVRTLPATDPNGWRAPGWVTIVVLPQSLERRPQPSFELRRRVRQYVEARAPAVVGVPHQIHVTGPDYLPIGAAATIAPLDPSEAGTVERRARQALEGFLHPVTGGPERRGWAFGRDVFLSDVAALLEALPGVDYVEELHLLLDGAPQGERAAVPPHRMVVAGDLRIKIKAAEL